MDKALLVSGPLIKPIQAGHKTVTRRLNGLEWLNERPDNYHPPKIDGAQAIFEAIEGRLTVHVSCPYGTTGDTLWVRENWFVSRSHNDKKASELFNEAVRLGYSADFIDMVRPEWSGRVRPSIHMPKWACRLFLDVTSITAERLHAITEESAKLEGVDRGIFREGPNTEKGEFHLEHNIHGSYLNGFKFTWMVLNGRESWDLNPWVWVVSFKLQK